MLTSPHEEVSAGSERPSALRRYSLLVLLPLLAGFGFLTWIADDEVATQRVVESEAGASVLIALQEPLPHFLLQLMVVLVLAKGAGWVLRRLGQPAVIGEMLAGIVLGPSVFGLTLPQAQVWLFPPSSLASLTQVSQLGVLVFMFAAGAEFNLSRLRGQRRLALVVSHAGIALPFVLGLLLAWALYGEYTPPGASLVAFALFIGVALSVTAFPVLLRIIDERDYRGRPIATVAIACAALTDATAWAILAGVVAWTGSQRLAQFGLHALLTLAGVSVLLLVVRPRLRHLRLDARHQSGAMIALILGALVCALLTQIAGLHLLFGAFLAGVAVSASPDLRRIVEERIEPFAVVLLLPLFFASTGLNTRIDLLSPREWLWCVAITGLATLGKLGGTTLAARTSGIAPWDAWRLGALMNTRGLMELILLSLGYELGLIDQRLYAVLVLMAIITTVTTGPLLSWIDRREASRSVVPPSH